MPIGFAEVFWHRISYCFTTKQCGPVYDCGYANKAPCTLAMITGRKHGLQKYRPVYGPCSRVTLFDVRDHPMKARVHNEVEQRYEDTKKNGMIHDWMLAVQSSTASCQSLSPSSLLQELSHSSLFS